MPIALVSLVDKDRQWFKSRHGLAVCETHRDQSFCAYAILPQSKDLLVVFDATLDPRFADNPLVTGAPGIRFYAGAPLRMSNGTALGSFCIIDTQPREFSAEDRATLLDLAAAAVDTLELHASRRLAREEAAERQWVETALRNSEGRLRRMAANTPGMLYQFVLNPDGTFHFPFVGEGCREFYGVEPQALYDRPELVLDVLSEKVRAAFMASLRESARTLEPWHSTSPYRAPDGTIRWLEGFSRPEPLADGKFLWNGMIVDVTARKNAERAAERAARRVSTVLESIGEAFFCLDHDWNFIYVNDHAERSLQCPRERLLGRCIWEAMPTAVNSRFEVAYRHAMETGEPVHLEAFASRMQTWIEVHAYPSDEGLSIYFRDIADRKNAEQEAERAAQRVRTVLESITNAFYSLDRDWRFTYVNDQAEKTTRTPPRGPARSSHLGGAPAQGRAGILPAFPSRGRDGPAGNIRGFFADAGEMVRRACLSLPRKGLSVYCQEITVRVKAQRQIEDSHKLHQRHHRRHRQRHFHQGPREPLPAHQPGGRGHAGRADPGKSPAAMTSPFSRPRVLTRSARTTRRSCAPASRAPLSPRMSSPGPNTCFLSTKSPYRDAAGNLLGVIGISREITEQRRAAVALREAKEEAEQGQPRQERIPFAHEPRAAHAAQRHPRLRPAP